MISPFFVGLIADRFFATERVLAALHLIGAVFLYLVTQATSFGAVYALMLAYCLCYFPTISLTNSLTLRQIKDAGSEFPFIRVFATIGWIVIGQTVGQTGNGNNGDAVSAGGRRVRGDGLYSLTLPHTPPAGEGRADHVRSLLGLDALVMLKDRSFLVFVVASVLACIPLTFYFSFTNAYLNEVGVMNAAGKMTLGQVSEVGMMLLMPFIFRRMSLKADSAAGPAGVVRAIRTAGVRAMRATGIWMFYAAILLHGVCFDFFFMTGQLYTDQEAPAHLRGTAQGFLTFLDLRSGDVYRVSASGRAVDFFTTTTGTTVTRNWQGFWLSSALSAAVILLLMLVFFKGHGKIRQKEAVAVAVD